MSTESTVAAIMLSFAVGASTTMWMVHCGSTSVVAISYTDAGSFDAAAYDTHWLDPAIACMQRETKATQERMYKAQEKEAELQFQIDVLSGAYHLREQLEKEGPGRAQQIANEVVLDAGTPERLAVALKYLKDRTLEFQRTYDGGT